MADAYKCVECEAPMHALTTAARHTYECSACGAKSVILEAVDKVFRYDVKPGDIPDRAGAMRPKASPASDSSGGGAETSVDGAVALLKMAGLSEAEMAVVDEALRIVREKDR